MRCGGPKQRPNRWRKRRRRRKHLWKSLRKHPWRKQARYTHAVAAAEASSGSTRRRQRQLRAAAAASAVPLGQIGASGADGASGISADSAASTARAAPPAGSSRGHRVPGLRQAVLRCPPSMTRSPPSAWIPTALHTTWPSTGPATATRLSRTRSGPRSGLTPSITATNRRPTGGSSPFIPTLPATPWTTGCTWPASPSKRRKSEMIRP